jgi:hypothetical protein
MANRAAELHLPGCIDRYGWRDMETAPRDGTHILACIATPTEDEDTGRTSDDKRIGVMYHIGGCWMQPGASHHYVIGQRVLAWQPLPPFTADESRSVPAHWYTRSF